MRGTRNVVYVVDDDRAHLASVERLLRASGYTVTCFESVASFLDHLPPDAVGCVVTDLRMPGMDGLALQKRVAASENPMPIVFLTAHGDIPSSVAAMRSGAEDYLVKTVTKERLLAAIERALQRNANERTARARTHDARARLDSLTDREREVMRHVLLGRLNKQTATALGITERSVKRHRASLMRKLEINSIAELTRFALEAGMNLEREAE